MNYNTPVIIIDDHKVTSALKVIRAAYDEMVHMEIGPWNIRYAMLLTLLTDEAAAKNNGATTDQLSALLVRAKQDYTNLSYSAIWKNPATRRSKD